MKGFMRGFEKRALQDETIAGLLSGGLGLPIGNIATGAYTAAKAPEGKKVRAGITSGATAALGTLGGAIAGGLLVPTINGKTTRAGMLAGGAIGGYFGGKRGHRYAESEYMRNR